jgi:hypothetical protein
MMHYREVRRREFSSYARYNRSFPLDKLRVRATNLRGIMSLERKGTL